MSAITGKVAGVYKQYAGTDKSKEIANFQSGETWSQVAGIQTNDIINIRLGTKSIRITEDDNVANDLATEQNNITLDLTQFESGASSNTNDYIYAIFFVSDITKITRVQLNFDINVTYNGTNKYFYIINSLVNGWNYVKIKKSAFTAIGSPNWATIQSIRIIWTSTTSAIGEYVSFQSLYLLDDAKDYDFALVNNTAYTLEFLTLFFNWTADITVDVEDTTAFLADTVQWKEFTPTLNSFTMSIEKFWANGDFLDSIQSDLILIAYTDTVNGYRYDGLAKTTSDGITCEVGGIVNETLELQGSGELTYNEVQIIDV